MPAFVNAMGQEMPYNNEPITWRVSVYAVAVRDGKLLMVEPTYLGGRLELPGGGVEVDETLAEGVVRECWEETGYHFRPESDPVFVTEQFFCHKRGTSYRHSVILTFVGSVSDEPDPSWEPGVEDKGAAVHWVPLDQVTEERLQRNHWQALLQVGLVKAP